MKKLSLLFALVLLTINAFAKYEIKDWISPKTQYLASGLQMLSDRALEGNLRWEERIAAKAEIAETSKELSEVEKKKIKIFKTGFFLRYRAMLYFKGAEVFANRPVFQENNQADEEALKMLDTGFALYNQSRNMSFEYYEEKYGSKSDSTHRVSVDVGAEYYTYLRGSIYSNLGKHKEAYECFISLAGSNPHMKPSALIKAELTYALARNAISSGSKLQPFPQSLVSYCFSIIDASYNPDHKIPDTSAHSWIVYLAKRVIDTVAARKIPYELPPYYTAAPNPKIFPLYNKLDDAGAMVVEVEPKGTKYARRWYFIYQLMVGASDYFQKEKSDTPEKQAAYSLLQKHFSKLAAVVENHYYENDRSSCDQVDWINKHMAQYQVDLEARTIVEKRINTCRKKVCGYCSY